MPELEPDGTRREVEAAEMAEAVEVAETADALRAVEAMEAAEKATEEMEVPFEGIVSFTGAGSARLAIRTSPPCRRPRAAASSCAAHHPLPCNTGSLRFPWCAAPFA